MYEKVEKYELIVIDYKLLEASVRLKLDEGWQPLGGPLLLDRGETGKFPRVGQVMVKYAIDGNQKK